MIEAECISGEDVLDRGWCKTARDSIVMTVDLFIVAVNQANRCIPSSTFLHTLCTAKDPTEALKKNTHTSTTRVASEPC